MSIDKSLKAIRRVLIADDEELNRLLFKELFTMLGIEAVTVSNGAEAFEYVKMNSEELDLVVLDIKMPVMDGAETFIRIREVKEDMKVIASTGFAHNEKIEFLKRNGVNAVLSKPYRLSELKEVLNQIA